MKTLADRSGIALNRAMAVQPPPVSRTDVIMGIAATLRVSEEEAEVLVTAIEAGDEQASHALTTEYMMRDSFLEE